MYEQNQDNDNLNRNAEQNENQRGSSFGEQSTYSYIFSSGTPTNQTPPQSKQPARKKSGPAAALVVVALLVCAALCFVAGFGGAYVAYTLFSDRTASSVGDAPSQDELHNDDPEGILDKGEAQGSIYGSAGEEAFSVSSVVRMVEDAVVVINASVSNGYYTTPKAGSGVIISEDGYILTCNHVIDGAISVTVTLNSGSEYAASLVGADEESDLAVLKIKPSQSETLTYVKHGISADLVKGEKVVAIGNPLGVLGGTVTQGIISSTERTVTTADGTQMTLLQTDAAINNGNSGGGLFNLAGELIGIVNAKYTSAEGLSFAIPIDSAYAVEKDLIKYGYVRGVLDHGLELLDITRENIGYYWYLHQIDTVGLYVTNSEFCEELENGDRIISVNGTAVNTTLDFENVLRGCEIGDVLTLHIYDRDEKVEKDVQLTLREYVPDKITGTLK